LLVERKGCKELLLLLLLGCYKIHLLEHELVHQEELLLLGVTHANALRIQLLLLHLEHVHLLL